MTNLKAGLAIQGLYTITRRNVKTGEEETFHTHNVITDIGIYGILCGAGWNTTYLSCGSGTGTPGTTDTDLFQKLWTADCTVSDKTSEWLDENTRKLTQKLTIPATESYVGSITEIGLYCSYPNSCAGLATHALLQDSEGNPISVNKTDVDEFVVKFDFIVSRSSERTGLRFNLNRGVFGQIGSRDYSGFGLSFSKSVNPDYYMHNMRNFSNGFTRDGRKYTFGKVRYGATYEDTGYVNSIVWGYRNSNGYVGDAVCAVVFPCTEVFPQTILKGLSLGAGDGKTTEFAPPLPAWVKDTEVIYKNGVALTRDVDYTCDNICNTQADKSMSAGNFIKKTLSGHYSEDSRYGGVGYCSFAEWVHYYDYGETEYVTKDTPLIMEYDTDPLIGNSINAIIPGSWKGGSSGMGLTFAVSEDGTNYTDIYTIQFTSGDFYDGTVHKLDQDYVMKFMKIYLSTPGSATESTILREDSVYHSDRRGARFFHQGPGIVFKEAPAEGDVLTMDAGIDRPWKSSDYIIDFAPVIQF